MSCVQEPIFDSTGKVGPVASTREWQPASRALRGRHPAGSANCRRREGRSQGRDRAASPAPRRTAASTAAASPSARAGGVLRGLTCCDQLPESEASRSATPPAAPRREAAPGAAGARHRAGACRSRRAFRRRARRRRRPPSVVHRRHRGPHRRGSRRRPSRPAPASALTVKPGGLVWSGTQPPGNAHARVHHG